AIEQFRMIEEGDAAVLEYPIVKEYFGVLQRKPYEDRLLYCSGVARALVFGHEFEGFGIPFKQPLIQPRRYEEVGHNFHPCSSARQTRHPQLTDFDLPMKRLAHNSSSDVNLCCTVLHPVR